MTRVGILDVESTIFAKGNPFATQNRLCLVGLRIQDEKTGEWVNRIFDVEYTNHPYSETLSDINRHIASLDTIVGFNLKFDLNWLARYGIRLSDRQRVFDCQLAEFILDFQRTPFPSLDSCLTKYNLGSKLDVVDRDYWSLGIDTNQVPLDILTRYLETDLEKTHELYQTLLNEFKKQPKLLLLANLHMQDLRVLQEMEFNGILFNWQEMSKAAEAVQKELDELDERIIQFVPNEFQPYFNPESGDHLSCLLYGGTISHAIGTEYRHTFKTGPRAGETVTRNKWENIRFDFPRLVTPPDGSELKKQGFYSTDEETLKSIRYPRDESGRSTKLLVQSILKRSELEKLLGTYYHGISETCKKYDWQDGLVHGTFNQTRVVTGRLSSEKPNQQNFPDPLMQFIVSRYPITTAATV